VKTKSIVIIIVVILILAIGIGAWFLLSGRKGDEDGGIVGEEEEEEEEEEEDEILTKGEVCGIPLPEYAKMTKIMEQKDEMTGSVFVMYGIEGSDRTEEIKDFYKTKTLAEGWKSESEMFMSGAWILAFSKGKDYSLQVSVSYMEGATQLMLDCKMPSKEEKENPYDSAKEVKPASDLGTAFHNDFKEVLDSTFGGAKLTSASSDKYFEELNYIVKRKITEEDAQEMRELLEEKEYETTSTSAGVDKYNYGFSKEVLGKEYDDINVKVWLEEEGSRQQKVSVSVYK